MRLPKAHLLIYCLLFSLSEAEERQAIWSHRLPQSTFINVNIPRGNQALTDELIEDRIQHVVRLGLGGMRVVGTTDQHAKLIERAYAHSNQIRTQYRIDQRWGSVPNTTYWAGNWGTSFKVTVDDFIWSHRLEDEIEYVAGLNEFYLEIKNAYARGALPEYWRHPEDVGKAERAIHLDSQRVDELFWAHFVEAYTEDSWRAMRPNDGSEKAAALAKVKVAGPAPAPPYLYSQWDREVGDLTPWIDVGNLHPYGPEHAPDQMQGFRNAIAGGLDRPGADFFGRLPLISSEFGTLSRSRNPGREAFATRPTWEVQAKTLLRQLVQATELQFPPAQRQNSYKGIERVFEMNQFYGLYNTGKPFGLIDSVGTQPTQDPDRFKDAYFAVANIMNLFRDNEGKDFEPEKLRYAIEAAPATSRSLLFQKSTGEFLLLFWLQESAWDQESESDPGGDNDSMFTLSFPEQDEMQIRLLDPHVREIWDKDDPVGTDLELPKDKALSLTAKDRVQILRLQIGN